MDIDKTAQDRNLLLVWVMNPAAAERILARAKKFASQEGLTLMTVSVQKQTRDNWAETLADLEKLDRAARNAEAELHVVYADDAAEAAVKMVKDLAPRGMFVGTPGNQGRNSFTDMMAEFCSEVPIYCVDTDGNIRML